MAGVVDPHVHINEPGRTEWEGFDTATKAATAGGITTLVDMPLNSSPVTTTAKAFDEKVKATNGQLHANCGFWGGVVPGNEKEIEPLIEKGVLGFKAFLTHSGIDEFPNVNRKRFEKSNAPDRKTWSASFSSLRTFSSHSPLATSVRPTASVLSKLSRFTSKKMGR